MKIEALTTFKHGKLSMQIGDSLTVDDETGQEVIHYGWAMNAETGERVDSVPANNSLDIHNSTLNHTTRI